MTLSPFSGDTMSPSLDLPAPVASYFEASNQRNLEAKSAPFDDNARVTDEGKEYIGRSAIRSWIEDTDRKYRYTIDPREAIATKNGAVVSAMLTGNFPGSPVILNFTFELAGSKIIR